MSASSKERRDIIDAIVTELEAARATIPSAQRYALEENIIFFRAMRSRRAYLKWLVGGRRKIDSSRLLEMNDLELPSADRWNAILHGDLTWLAKERKQPEYEMGRDMLASTVERLPADTSQRVTMLDVGCGAMELDRQVILELRKRGVGRPLLIVGLDNTRSSLNQAAKNLSGVEGIEVVRCAGAAEELKEWRSVQDGSASCRIVLVQHDCLAFVQALPAESFDVAYHLRFRHHLPADAAAILDHELARVGRVVLEIDGRRCVFPYIITLLAAWPQDRPILANAWVFSALRSPSKRELICRTNGEGELIFPPPQGYLWLRKKNTNAT